MLDPSATGGCLRLPAAGNQGAEYVLAIVAASGQIASNGVSGPYHLTAQTAGQPTPTPSTSAALPGAALGVARPTAAATFHAALRAYERALSRTPGVQRFRGPAPGVSADMGAVGVPPAVGDKRTFQVLAGTTQPYQFTEVTATAKYVGRKVAIYLDDAAPAGGYSPAELDSVGTLFDTRMYGIDTTAFGTESDIDGNGVVIALLTPAINRLSPNCNTTGSIVLGFFFGLDLLPTQAHSNGGEIFYSLVPDPANASCTVSTDFAKRVLGPTFIHEFQHMINFNQHVLRRGGVAEDTWLNEGLSHFAEELGARELPDASGEPAGSRFSQFAFGDVDNAYHYLENPEAYFAVEPGTSLGILPERGANWLFVRWLMDHFDTDTVGSHLTHTLLNTTAVGQANVEAATGEKLATLLTEWQLANYVGDLPGLTDATGRLRYHTWDFRHTFATLNAQDAADFPQVFPLVPDSIGPSGLDRGGTLRGGSAHFVRLVQPANGDVVTVRLSADGAQGIGPALNARFGVVRLH